MTSPSVLTGKVVQGRKLGRTVGMPTANLLIEEGELPSPGVYATRICVEGEWYLSVTNIGTRPSVDCDETVTVETHILDFERNIYGKSVILEVHDFLRPIQRFESLQAVREQVKLDILRVKNLPV